MAAFCFLACSCNDQGCGLVPNAFPHVEATSLSRLLSQPVCLFAFWPCQEADLFLFLGWENRFQEMEYGMIYFCWGLWGKSKNVLKWYTLVANSLLNDGWWYGSLYWEMMVRTLKYRNNTTLMNPPILGLLALLAFSFRIKVISGSWAVAVQNSSWKVRDFEYISIKDFNSIHTQSI